MKRQLLILLILTPLLTSLFLLVFPVQAEEFENIDSFNSPVDERWNTPLTTSTETLTVLDGILNYTDVGLQGQSSARSRQLQKNDFKITGRFQTPTSDKLEVEFEGANTTDPVFDLDVEEGTGTTLNDRSPNNHDGTMTDISWSTDTFNSYLSNYSVLLDPSNSTTEISMGDHADFTFAPPYVHPGDDDPFSFECWFKVNDTTPNSPVYLIGKDREYFVQDPAEYSLYVQGNDFEFCLHDWSSSKGFLLFQTASYDYLAGRANMWNYLVATYDGSTTKEGMNLYLNGNLLSGSRYDPEDYRQMDDTNADLIMGGHETLDGDTKLWMDELRLWGEELTAQDISDRYEYFTDISTDLRAYIGIENSQNTLNLTIPSLAIILDPIDQNDSSPLKVSYAFTTNNVLYEENFFNLTKNVWYRFEIDVDLFRSQIEFNMFFDNETTVPNSNKNILDLSTTVQPDIFAASIIDIFFGNEFNGNGTLVWFLDYIKSPFEEFQFEFSSGVETSSTRFTSVNEFGGIAISNGSDFSESSVWSYVIPDYDSITGVMHIATNVSDEADLDDGSMQVIIQVLAFEQDPDDLSITIETLVAFQLAYHLGAPTIKGSDTISFAAGNTFFEKTIGGTGASMESAVDVGFVIYKSSDEKLISQLSTQGETFTHNTQINTTEFPFSNEIALRFRYLVFHQNTNENIRYTFGIKDFQPNYRDLLGWLPELPDTSDVVGAIANFIVLPLMAGFRLLGAVLAAGTTSMLGPLAALGTPLSSIFNKLDDVYEEIVGDVITFLGDIPDILTEIQGLAADVAGQIWTAIIDEIENILPEVISVLLTIVSTLAELGIALVVWLWDNTVEAIYPGAGALVADLVNGIKILITWVTTGVDFVITFQFAFFLLLTIFIFVGASERVQNLVEWILEVIDTMAVNVVQGFSILGVAIIIPLGAIWTILMIFWWNGGP